MLSSLSSNVILSKARAMYGRRLKKDDYLNLLNCQSVPEIARYLKDNTAYAETLSGINETEIHRGQLEAKLKQKLFEDASSLCQYELSVGEHFSQYLISRSEIEQILHCLVFLQAGTPEEYLFSLPMFLNKHTHIDLPALGRVKSYEDLLDALSHTPYRKILEPFRPIPGIPLNYTGIENALYSYLYENMFSMIDRYAKGETGRQLRQIFESFIDFNNYIRIIRLKSRYKAGPDFIRSSLIPFGTIKEKYLNELLASETREEMLDVMKTLPSGKRYLKTSHDYPDEVPEIILLQTCRHDIHFSTHPPVVMLSYIFILQLEIQDIITIVEGVRYQLPTKEIEKLLTINNVWKG